MGHCFRATGSHNPNGHLHVRSPHPQYFRHQGPRNGIKMSPITSWSRTQASKFWVCFVNSSIGIFSLFPIFPSAKAVMGFFRLDLTLLGTSPSPLCLLLLEGGSLLRRHCAPSRLHALPCGTGLTSCRLLSLLPSLTAASFLPATLELAAKCLLTPVISETLKVDHKRL